LPSLSSESSSLGGRLSLLRLFVIWRFLVRDLYTFVVPEMCIDLPMNAPRR
jgi:hypothetical protein